MPETAPEAPGQLYNLAEDPGETMNLFFSEPEKRHQLQALLKKLTSEENGRSAPKNRKPMGIKLLANLASEALDSWLLRSIAPESSLI